MLATELLRSSDAKEYFLLPLYTQLLRRNSVQKGKNGGQEKRRPFVAPRFGPAGCGWRRASSLWLEANN